MVALLESVIGHKALIKNLREAVSTKRLRGTHLFAGPSGVGKKMIALGLAQVYLCPERQNAQACGQCPSCLKIQKQQSESVFLLKPEGAQIKIDEVRALIDFLSLKSWHNGQVVIIDGAETLNSQAANALLKSLEEPPESTLIFLITSTASALLPTVRSRCQLWRFSPLSFAELKSLTNGPDWLVEAAQGSLELAQVF